MAAIDSPVAPSTLAVHLPALDALVPFLCALAAGEVPAVPGSQPGELAEALGRVVKGARSARSQ